MAIFIFHSIQLGCLCAFNSVKASDPDYLDLSYFGAQFFPAIFLQLCKKKKHHQQQKQKQNKDKTRRNKKRLNVLIIKIPACPTAMLVSWCAPCKLHCPKIALQLQRVAA